MIENVDVVHPFGATLYGDEIFWTDWGRKSVEAIDKHGTIFNTCITMTTIIHIHDINDVFGDCS